MEDVMTQRRAGDMPVRIREEENAEKGTRKTGFGENHVILCESMRMEVRNYEYWKREAGSLNCEGCTSLANNRTKQRITKTGIGGTIRRRIQKSQIRKIKCSHRREVAAQDHVVDSE